jgi:hypothetical protein
MTNTRKYIFPGRRVRTLSVHLFMCSPYSLDFVQTLESKLRGRLYSASRSNPSPIHINTRTCKHGKLSTRYPMVEGVMDGAGLQPHVHNCTVTVLDGTDSFIFKVFFKRHRHLPLNKSLPVHGDHCRLRGDVVVMRAAARGDSVVGMRGCDAKISDWLIQR